MGIPGLWKAIAPSMQQKSLSEMILAEALTKAETGEGCVNIGIDATPLLYAIQGSLIAARNKGASWALTGSDTERSLLIEQLGFWNELPANIGFFFDGPDLPKEKRGKRVRARPHGLIHTFKELIRGFNFLVVEAPGEAEAELAHLNQAGLLHHIVTPDADAFLFGAVSVIRSPRDPKNRDSVEVYMGQSLRAQDPERLSRAGVLFIAVVSGGDYNLKGLPGCGFDSAFALAKGQLAPQLLDLAQSSRLSDAEIECSRMAWREHLCDELTSNRSGLLTRRYPSVARNVPLDFPNMSVVRQYTNPTVSGLLSAVCSADFNFWSHSSLSVPNPSTITATICDCFPQWNWGEVFAKLENCVLPGYLTRQLVDIREARSLSRTQGLGFASVNMITKVERQIKHKSIAFPYYRVLIWPLYASNKAFDMFLAKHNRNAAPGEVTTAVQAHVKIPGPILDRALPEKVDDYRRDHPHAQLLPHPTYWEVLKEKIATGSLCSHGGPSTQYPEAGPSNLQPRGYVLTVEDGREVLEICSSDEEAQIE